MAKNYYDILGVSQGADKAAIKTAFRTKAKDCHPDRNNGSRKAEAQFKALNEAYETLKDDRKRAAYDAELAMASRASASSGPYQGASQGHHHSSGHGQQQGFRADPFDDLFRRASSGRGQQRGSGAGSFEDIFEDLFRDFTRARSGQGQSRQRQHSQSDPYGDYARAARGATGQGRKQGRTYTLDEVVDGFNQSIIGKNKYGGLILKFLEENPGRAEDVLQRLSPENLYRASDLKAWLFKKVPDAYTEGMLPFYIRSFNDAIMPRQLKGIDEDLLALAGRKAGVDKELLAKLSPQNLWRSEVGKKLLKKRPQAYIDAMLSFCVQGFNDSIMPRQREGYAASLAEFVQLRPKLAGELPRKLDHKNLMKSGLAVSLYQADPNAYVTAMHRSYVDGFNYAISSREIRGHADVMLTFAGDFPNMAGYFLSELRSGNLRQVPGFHQKLVNIHAKTRPDPRRRPSAAERRGYQYV